MSKSSEAAQVILDKISSGTASRSEILPSLVPSGGIPRHEADRLWLNRQYDQGTAALRRSGVDAVSFGGCTFIVGDEMSDEDIGTLQRYRDRERLRAEKHEQNAARYDAVIKRARKSRDCEGQFFIGEACDA